MGYRNVPTQWANSMGHSIINQMLKLSILNARYLNKNSTKKPKMNKACTKNNILYKVLEKCLKK